PGRRLHPFSARIPHSRRGGPSAAPSPADPVSPDSPALADAARAWFGVYVHVPFCSHKCGYCDFASWAGMDELQERYVDAVCREGSRASLADADTVFVGGGTPSRLAPGLLTRLLSVIPRSDDAEVTAEANPESASGAFFDEAVG